MAWDLEETTMEWGILNWQNLCHAVQTKHDVFWFWHWFPFTCFWYERYPMMKYSLPVYNAAWLVNKLFSRCTLIVRNAFWYVGWVVFNVSKVVWLEKRRYAFSTNLLIKRAQKSNYIVVHYKSCLLLYASIVLLKKHSVWLQQQRIWSHFNRPWRLRYFVTHIVIFQWMGHIL